MRDGLSLKNLELRTAKLVEPPTQTALSLNQRKHFTRSDNPLEGGANLKIVLADACADEPRMAPPTKEKNTRARNNYYE